MFAQVYNSTKGMSAIWWRDQHQWCQEGGEDERIENGFVMPFVLCFVETLSQRVSYHIYYPVYL
jgi:hypothetical protein